MIRVPISEAEAVALIHKTRDSHFAVSMELGTRRLLLDLSRENDRLCAQALLEIREGRS